MWRKVGRKVLCCRIVNIDWRVKEEGRLKNLDVCQKVSLDGNGDGIGM